MYEETDDKNLERDKYSKGLVSTDLRALEAHRKKIKTSEKKEERIKNLETEVKEIKNLLLELLKEK
tara:strand:+ start:14 stop:211 length:198 start_codon:yes stop_codon:yes gene_type:complete